MREGRWVVVQAAYKIAQAFGMVAGGPLLHRQHQAEITPAVEWKLESRQLGFRDSGTELTSSLGGPGLKSHSRRRLDILYHALPSRNSTGKISADRIESADADSKHDVVEMFAQLQSLASDAGPRRPCGFKIHAVQSISVLKPAINRIRGPT